MLKAYKTDKLTLEGIAYQIEYHFDEYTLPDELGSFGNENAVKKWNDKYIDRTKGVMLTIDSHKDERTFGTVPVDGHVVFDIDDYRVYSTPEDAEWYQQGIEEGDISEYDEIWRPEESLEILTHIKVTRYKPKVLAKNLSTANWHEFEYFGNFMHGENDRWFTNEPAEVATEWHKLADKHEFDEFGIDTGDKALDIVVLYCCMDYERYIKFNNQNWWYEGITVTILDEDGNDITEASLWGIDSEIDLTDRNEIIGDLISECRGNLDKEIKEMEYQLNLALKVKELVKL